MSGDLAQALAAGELAAESYEATLAQLLWGLLLEVIARHQPQILPTLRSEADGAELPPALLARALQAQGIWFQLLAIAEQNAAMRRRRELEKRDGYTQVRGTFAHLWAEAALAGIPAPQVRTLLASLRIRPVITAHPTEAKRVTVLERHRVIYRRLMDLESPRWTQRERLDLVARLRQEIEILWLTGELRLEKPTVSQEVSWGLHFFSETLFEAVPALLQRLEQSLRHSYPGEHFEIRPFFQFGAWIGGDRDGNPFVTNEVTRRTLQESRAASLRQYRARLTDLIRHCSVSQNALLLPPAFGALLDGALRESGDGAGITARNPGEPIRQFLVCLSRRLEATAARDRKADGLPAATPYHDADALVQDLRGMEEALSQAGCTEMAVLLARPLRFEVETFRFSTVRLDLRENSTSITAALREVWAAEGGQGEPPAAASPEWKARIVRRV